MLNGLKCSICLKFLGPFPVFQKFLTFRLSSTTFIKWFPIKEVVHEYANEDISSSGDL